MAIPRSLADDLRGRDDAALGRLLARRPDLVHPVPSDMTALTTRATTGPSVSRCLDGLDALHLHVLRAAAELTVATSATADAIVLAAALPLPPEAEHPCRAALADLVDSALVWGASGCLRAVHPVRDMVAAAPTPQWPPPALPAKGSRHDQAEVDSQAALHARETLAQVHDLLDDWSVQPPSILRSGGLPLRDFGTARARLHADWPRVSLDIEVAHAARLFADDHEESPRWVPTDHYDAWLASDPAAQWIELVGAWLDLVRLPSMAHEKTQVLSPDRDRRAIPGIRRQVLALLAALPAGHAPSAAELIAVLDDREPRRAGDLRRDAVAATLREAGELGVTAAGALSTAGRLLLAMPAADAAARRAQAHRVSEALVAALPVDVDHVLIQADLTVVAPGPLVSPVARSLRLLADVESRGHGTVYRISEDSIRRTLDAGWDASSIHGLLAEISSTPVPQPLTYLIDDVARRHGAVRIGNALGYVRCDNPETLSALIADRRLRALGLSRLAETVLISQAPAPELISALRAAGYAPAAESADGSVVIRRPEDHRTLARRPAPVTTRRLPEDALIAAAVRTLRAADRATADRRGSTVTGPASASPRLASLSAAAIVTTLRSAIAERTPMWIGYADTDGTITEQIVDPIRIHAGVLTAFDHRTEQVRTFAVSRVTGAADLPPDDDTP
jgi:hypothetical protein